MVGGPKTMFVRPTVMMMMCMVEGGLKVMFVRPTMMVRVQGAQW